MEKNALLLDAIILLVIIAPIAVLIIYAFSQDKRVKRQIDRLCKTNEITLNEFEINGDVVIGLDANHKKMIVSNRKDVVKNFQVIDLDQVNQCKTKVVNLNKKTIDWVGLELLSKNGIKDIMFYSETDEDGPSTDPQACLHKAHQWEDKVRPLVRAS